MTTRQPYLEALALRSRCVQCKTQPRVAWFQGEYKLRCECHPKAPVLEKLPKSALSRYLAGEEPQDALVKMQGDRIKAKKESK